MSDSASGSQSARRSFGDGSSPQGSSSNGSSHGSRRDPSATPAIGRVLPTEQPTVITSQPPISTPSQSATLCLTGPEKLTPGMCLGQFELLEYVGGGGMGHVYRALDTALARPVALKVLSREQVSDADTLQRFRNEARSAARLNHENIVQVYFAGEEQGISFIAFEFIEGTNLRELVQQKGALPLGEALSYTLQIAEALAYASQQNVVHRDIKPSNVLITPEGRAKLIDMGLARLQGPNGAEDLTASGVTLGTFDYISPEQARDPRNADVRSDIYSLGCTLFFTLAGQPPFPEGTVLQKLLQHQGDEPPDVRQFRPDVPEEVSRVLRRMMAKAPQQRYQEPARLIEALVGLAAEMGLQPAGPGQHEWVVARPAKRAFYEGHLPWLLPVVVLVGAVLGLHFLGSSPAPHEFRLAPAANRSAAPAQAPQPAEDSGERTVASAADTASGKTTPSASVAPAAAPPAPETPTPRRSEAEAVLVAPPAQQWEALAVKPQASPTLVPGAQSGLSAASLARDARREGLPPRETAAASLARQASGEGARNPAPAPVPGKGRLLVVDPQGTSGGDYASLKEACAAARNDDTIELRYNGRVKPETPVSLSDLRVTIKAAADYQPVVRFQPTESEYRRSMFQLSGCEVAMFKVALELVIPEDLPPDNSWTLFELDQVEMLAWKQCSLTIRNVARGGGQYNPDVAFVRLKANPFPEAFDESEPSHRLMLRLDDCIVRGEAVFLRNRGMQPLDLEWRNGLLATSEWLLAADGSAATRANETMHVTLDHLTALVGQGLCQFDQEEGVLDELVNLRCTDSILLGSPTAVLIEQSHVNDLERARQRIQWYGDRNCYQAFRIFWRITPRDASKRSEQLDFLGWQQQWMLRETDPIGSVVFRAFPAKDRPVHSYTPDDFALDPSRMNAALRSDRNGKNAGLLLEGLPTVSPLPPLPAKGWTPPDSGSSRPPWPELPPRGP